MGTIHSVFLVFFVILLVPSKFSTLCDIILAPTDEKKIVQTFFSIQRAIFEDISGFLSGLSM